MHISIGNGSQKVEEIICICTLTNSSTSSLGKTLADLQKICEDKVSDCSNHKKRETVIIRDDGIFVICSETVAVLMDQINELYGTKKHVPYIQIDNIWFNGTKFDCVYDLKVGNKLFEDKLEKKRKENKVITITRNKLKQSAILFKNGNIIICSVPKKDILDKVNAFEINQSEE